MSATPDELIFGAAGEARIEPILRALVAADIKHTTDPFHVFDYASKTERSFFELKTRRVKKDAYPSTVVGANKVAAAKAYYARGVSTTFVFAFTDGDYFVRWPFTYTEKALCRHDRSRAVLHAYISSDLLQPLNRYQETGPAALLLRPPLVLSATTSSASGEASDGSESTD